MIKQGKTKQSVAVKQSAVHILQYSIGHSKFTDIIWASWFIMVVNRNSAVVLIFLEPPVLFSKGNGLREVFSVQKTLSVVKLCQMQEGLIYVNTDSVRDWVNYRMADLRVTQCGSFTCFVLNS